MTNSSSDDITELFNLDFNSLRSHGIELVQKMAGKIWTDFNLHDPGVTILEALCYAITDLAYQTDFDIKDLLSDEDGQIDYGVNSFFLKQNILTCNPVTEFDHTKALLDEVEEVDAVWLTPAANSGAFSAFPCLYRIEVQVNKFYAKKWLQKSKENTPDDDFKKKIKEKVTRSFVSKRNLCEDIFDEVILLKPVGITIKAEIQIESYAIPEQLLTQIYVALQDAINKPVKYLTESEMLHNRYTIDEIYRGPLLKNGFLADSQLLSQRPLTVEATDLVKKISDIKGVVLVKSLLLSNGGKFEKALTCDNADFFFLDLTDFKSLVINLFIDKYIVPIDKTLFGDLLRKAYEASYRGKIDKLQQKTDGTITENITTDKSSYLSEQKLKGNYHDNSVYYSLQNYFPLVYGIGHEALLNSATPERKGQARQLKAYLMLFEQILANYLAQVNNIPSFFSNDILEKVKTYFSYPLYTVPNVSGILKEYAGQMDETLEEFQKENQKNYPNFSDLVKAYTEQKWKQSQNDIENGYLRYLNKIIEHDSVFADRKNRILDHLLARFNEFSITYPAKLYYKLYEPEKNMGRVTPDIEWKALILKDFDQFNYNRTRGLNYLAVNKEIYNFEGNIKHLLRIENNDEPLTSILDSLTLKKERIFPSGVKQNERNTEPSTDNDTFWGTENQNLILNKGQVNDLIEAGMLAGAESIHTGSFVFMNQDITLFKNAININNYRIGPDPYQEKDYLVLYKAPDDKRWGIISRYSDGNIPALSTIKNLIKYLINISVATEDFYLIEHILLRPDLNSKSFGFKFYKDKGIELLEQKEPKPGLDQQPAKKEWLTLAERKKALDDILNLKPDPAFLIAHQSKDLAADIQTTLKNANDWIKNANVNNDFIKKGLSFLDEAKRILGNPDIHPDKSSLKGAGANNQQIAEKNIDLAKQLKGLLEKLNQISEKKRTTANSFSSVTENITVNGEYLNELMACLSTVNSLSRDAGNQYKLAEKNAVETDQQTIDKISELGKINTNGQDDYNYLTELFDAISQYNDKRQHDAISLHEQKLYPQLELRFLGEHDEPMEEDFFFFNISAVFPDWPARFQDKGFRACAEGLFDFHSPANISVKVLWLSIEKMKRFEPLFLEWKKSLSQADQHDKMRWEHAKKLIAFLKKEERKLK